GRDVVRGHDRETGLLREPLAGLLLGGETSAEQDVARPRVDTSEPALRRVDARRRDVVAAASTELAGRGADDPDAAVADLRSGVGGALLELRRVGAFLGPLIAPVAHPPRPAARGRRGDTGRRARPCCAVRIAVASTAARSGCGAGLPTSAAARTPRGRR